MILPRKLLFGVSVVVSAIPNASTAAAQAPAEDLLMGSGVIAPSPAFVLGDTDGTEVLGVGGGKLAVTGSIERAHSFSPRQWSGWLDGELFTVFLGNGRTTMVAVGTSAAVRYMHWPAFGVGAGLSSGYLFDLTAQTERRVLRESGFFGVFAIPASLAFEPFDLQVVVPVWFSETSREGIVAFRPALVGTFVTLTVSSPLLD